MLNFMFKILFVIVTAYFLIKTIFYGIYEINTLKNKVGGIAIISISIVSVLLANIVL